MVDSPEVSVVIPVYGRGTALLRTVNSALAQQGLSLEIILVDDCSPDDPFAALGALRDHPQVRIVRHAVNQGASAARNSGTQAAQGRYVAFLDSDDEWESQKLLAQWQAAAALDHPDRFLCVTMSRRLMPGGKTLFMPRRGIRQGERAGDYIYVEGAMAQTSSFFASRALALDTPFDTSLRQFEDHLFFIQALESGAAYAFIDQPLSIYHDEETQDRLNMDKALAHYDRYEAVVRPLLSCRAARAFRARYRARLLVPGTGHGALRMVLAALATGSLKIRFLPGIIRAWLRLMGNRG